MHHTAYSFGSALPGQVGSAWGEARRAATPPRPAQPAPQGWSDALTQYQAIYEELLASPEWGGPDERPAPGQLPLSACDLTRELAGWSPPQPGAR